MTSGTDIRRAKVFGRVASISVGALSLLVIIAILPRLWQMFPAIESIWDIFFALPFAFCVVAIACIGASCLLLARRAWSSVSADVVRRISFIAAVLSSAGLFALTETLGMLGYYLWAQSILLLLVIVGGLLYKLYSRLLIRWLIIPDAVDSGRRQKAAKSFFLVLAFLIWVISSSIIVDCALIKQGNTHPPEYSWWFWLALLGSLVPAYLVYKLGMYVALRKSHADDQTKPIPNC